MLFKKVRSCLRNMQWGLFAVPLAPVEITVAYAPHILAVVLLFSGFQFMIQRCYRTGSLLVGASLAVMLTTGVIGI